MFAPHRGGAGSDDDVVDTGASTIYEPPGPVVSARPDGAPRHGWTQRAARCAWALVATGIALRLIRYFANRSLWLDEAYLAESILTYSFRQLVTQELMHWQAAPVGFLLLEKLAVTSLGTSEYALRFVPLLAGLASVPLFYAVARRALPPTGGLLALAMFVLIEPLVYYSAEVKQYGTDVAIGLLILWLAQRLAERPDSTLRLALLAATGGAAMFLSHPAVFVLAAVGLVLLGSFLRGGRGGPALRLALVGGVWVALFVFNYAVFLQPLTRHPGLVTYWSPGYMPWDAGAVPWLGTSLYRVFSDYGSMWLPLPLVAVLAAVLGITWLWGRDRRVLGMIGLPILLALLGAALHRFPFSGRLILFLVPTVILLIGAGAQAALDRLLPRHRVLAMAFLLLLLGPSVGRAAFFAAFPPGREEIKAVLANVRDRKQPGDVIYVFHLSEVPFRYYRDRFGLGPDRFGISDVEWVAGKRIESTEPAFEDDLSRLRGRERVWVLLTHMRALGGPDEGAIVPRVLDCWGTRIDDQAARGARVMLYDLRKQERGH